MASQVIDFFVSLSVLIALIVLFEAGRRARSDAVLLARTNDELAVATLQIQRSQAVTRSRMAQILHGGVQGQLSSMSLALRRYVDSEAAGEKPSLPELRRRLDYQLAQVQEELARLTSTNIHARVDLDSSIRKSILQWRGLLAIAYDIDVRAADVLTASDYLSWAASEIIDATITNANRHGEANRVWIAVTVDHDADPDLLVVTIEDDGSGPPDDVTPGMGLDGIAAFGGSWQMTPRRGGGCCLRVHLPLA
jgi:signal transduction histidine kinase